MDIVYKVDIGILGKRGTAAHLTYNASLPARNMGHTVADETDYSASPPAHNTDHTQVHPKRGHNNRGHIPVPVQEKWLEQTNIKT